MNTRVPEDAAFVSKIRDRVRFFKDVGPSAQHLLLEHGAWDRLNEWLKVAIGSGNACFVKEVIGVARTMPTSYYKLMASHSGLPLTAQELLINLGQQNINFGIDSKTVKMECEELFAKWLRVKKNDLGEGIDQDRIVLMNSVSGEACVIARILNLPGYAYMAKNGKVEILRLDAVHNLANILPPPSSLPSSMDPRIASLNAKKAVAKVFCTSTNRSERLLEEMLQSSSTKIKKFGNSPAQKGQQKCVDKNKAVPILEGTPERSRQINKSLNKKMTRAAETVWRNVEKAQEQLESDDFRMKIGDDHRPRKKMVHWWGQDGVKEIHEYNSCQSNYQRQGCVKEIWISFSLKEENDERIDDGNSENETFKVSSFMRRSS